MRKLIKKKPTQPSLQPWQHEQQQNSSINHNYISLPYTANPQSPIKQIQDNANPGRLSGFCYERQVKSSENGNRTKQYIKNQSTNKKQKIDYVKKYQQNLKSHYCIPSNYNALLSDNMDQFVPLNPNNSFNPYIKRPLINTTYIGYYEQKPFYIQNLSRSFIKRDKIRSKSMQSNSRPVTSNPAISYDIHMARLQNHQQFVHFNERATLSVGGCHLQKILKIKQKLRQKLKRKSQKKDIERGLYVKSAMKIQQQLNYTTTHQNQTYVHTRMPKKSMKSSSKLIDSNNQKVKVDKWKQYMRQKSQKQKKSKLIGQNTKNKQFFAVLTGAIYR